jgi:hypothetical protein
MPSFLRLNQRVIVMRLFALPLLYMLLIPQAAIGQTLQPGTTWVNEGGSELTINTIGNDGSLAGTYVNKVEGFDCKDEPMTLSGWLEGALVSFSVRWKSANKDCKSITSWTGYLASGRLFTDWDLIYTSASTGLPAHLKNSNVFRPK